MRSYNYDMAIRVKGSNNKWVDLPDPSEWNYQVGDLDASAQRDADGYLHRAYVTTKINYEFSWKALEWEMLQEILDAVHEPKFTLEAPDPRTFRSNYTGEYYVGDRTGKSYYFITDRVTDEQGNSRLLKPEVSVFDLKLKFVEY